MLQVKNEKPIMSALNKEQVELKLQEQDIQSSLVNKVVLNPYDGTIDIVPVNKTVRFGSSIVEGTVFTMDEVIDGYAALSKKVYELIITDEGLEIPISEVIQGVYPVTILPQFEKLPYKMIDTKLRVMRININDDFSSYIKQVITNEDAI